LETELTEEERQKEIARPVELLERPVKANLTMRAFYKWFLEFVRNAMVVAALFFLARRSGDWWLYGIAIAAGFALVAYSHTYIENGWHRLEFKSQGTRRKIVVGVTAALLQLSLVAITIGMYFTIDKIVTVQVQAGR
jgi:hypothetical protein